jgi:hypothetical protein
MTERIAFYPGSGQISYEHLKKGFESSFKPKMPVAFKPRPSEKGVVVSRGLDRDQWWVQWDSGALTSVSENNLLRGAS